MDHYHSKEYDEYMQSDAWLARCRALKEKRGHRCERCGVRNVPIQFHHLNYDRLGHELDDDLQIVCLKCHPKADRERIEWEQRRRQQNGTQWRVM